MIIIITMAKFLIVATFQRFASKQKVFENSAQDTRPRLLKWQIF